MMIMLSHCKKCGEVIDDEPWKTLCLRCWLKENNPEAYEAKYKMKDIICERCGEEFTDEAWKTMCFPCWLKDLNEKKQEDLEEREQFK